jgi:dTDP-4-amino-4,6-dideoxygalactose transaminase
MSAISVQVMKPVLPALDVVTPYLAEVYESGIFSNHGPKVRDLERRYAEWFNVSPEQVVAISNGTVAIAAAALWEDNPTYLVPEWTFPATAMGPLEVGARVEFRDVHPTEWTLAVTDDDRAAADSVIPVVVAPFGHPVNLANWAEFPRVIIDAAACAGNRPDLSTMAPGWAATISLHATKVLGCGEGGLVIFGDVDRAKIAREWINFGFSGTRVTNRIGTNGKMSEFAASFALAALDGVERELSEWKAVRTRAAAINAEFGLKGGPMPDDSRIPYWLVAVDSAAEAERFTVALDAANIQTRKWWPAALTATKPFRNFATNGNTTASALADTVLGLPMFRELTDAQFEHIRATLAELRK